MAGAWDCALASGAVCRAQRPKKHWSVAQPGQPVAGMPMIEEGGEPIVGRGIMYPFTKPGPGEWHSPWYAYNYAYNKVHKWTILVIYPAWIGGTSCNLLAPILIIRPSRITGRSPAAIRRWTVFSDTFIAAATSFIVIRGSGLSSRLVIFHLFVQCLIGGKGGNRIPVARGLPRQQTHQHPQRVVGRR